MPSRDEIYQAILNADKAGDSESVRTLGAYLQTMQDKPAEMPAPEPSTGQKVANGASDIVAGAVRGAGSIGATLLYPIDKATDLIEGDRKGGVSRNDERRAQMDRGLKTLANDVFGTQVDPESLMFKVPKLGAEVAGTMGAGGGAANVLRMVPGAAAKAPSFLAALESAGMTAGGGNLLTRIAGGATNGAISAGMVDPSQAGAGAVIGGALPPAVSALGKVGSVVGSALKSEPNPNAELARKAIQTYGIPIGPADMSTNGMVKGLRSLLNDTPIIGKIGESQNAAKQVALNTAVGETFGTQGAASLTPQVMDAAKKRLGSEFDRIWNSNALQVDAPMFQKLIDLQTVAAKLPKNEGGSLNAELQDLLGKMQPDAAGNMVVPGDVANKFQSYLRRRAEGSAGLRNELSDLRQTIIGAFNRSVSPADAAALTSTRSQYKAFKTVEPILDSAEAGIAGRVEGDVPASLLSGAVKRGYADPTGAPLTDLAQIASRLMVNRTPQTGGSARAAIQNSAIGAGLAAGSYTNPLAALLAIPTAAGAQVALGSPRLALRMANRTGQPNALAQLLMNPDLQQAAYRSAPAAMAGR